MDELDVVIPDNINVHCHWGLYVTGISEKSTDVSYNDGVGEFDGSITPDSVRTGNDPPPRFLGSGRGKFKKKH